MIIYSQQNETVDQICWRIYKRTSDMVELVYLLNPQLCDLPVILPYGTRLLMPEKTPAKTQSKRLKLWD